MKPGALLPVTPYAWISSNPMPPRQSSGTFFWLILIAAFIGGGLPVAIRIGVEALNALGFSCARFVIAVVGLVPLVLLSGRTLRSQLRLSPVLLGAALANCGNVIFFAFGVARTSPVLSQILYLLSPPLICLVEWLFMHEHIRRIQVYGIVLATLGAGLSIYARLSGHLAGEPLGILLVALAVLSYSGYPLLSRHARERYDPLLQTFTMSCITAVVLAAVATLTGQTTISSARALVEGSSTVALWRFLAAAAYAGILGGAVYYLCIQRIVRMASAFSASTVLYLQPATAVFWAWLVDGTLPSPLLVGGGVVSIFGAWMTSRRG